MSRSMSPRRRALAALAALVAAGAASISAPGCAPEPINASVRSLERAGKVAFVCMAGPGSDGALRPLADCAGAVPTDDGVTKTPDDFGDGSEPHLYALVTLETRGEIAMIDTTAEESSVLDMDPSTPGENALPVGAQPTAIVATPKATAAFVATAEVGKPAIYALPGEVIRPCEADAARCDLAPPSLTSWPACRLPSAPGAMILVSDPAVGGEVRESCDGAYGPVAGTTPAFGDIDREGLGRQKLVVALPKEGKLVVIDAQSLLTSAPGGFDDCVIEHEVALTTDVPAPPPAQPVPDGPACVPPAVASVQVTASGVSTPSSLALGGARLYVGDLTTPVIHVVEASNPCGLTELGPLLPTSQDDPDRRVVTAHLAVSPSPTPSLERYLYAVDVEDRSLMVFDVSDDSRPAVPIVRPGAALNPLQPRDRIRFASAPTDVVIIHRDDPKSTAEGVAPFGTSCDPDPDAIVCTSSSTDCDVGTLYRTSSDYGDGAGPLTFRGAFAMVALSSGQIAVVDIEDFDAPCRGPKVPSTALGCATDGGVELRTTDESSCNVVLPHAPRAGNYLLTNDDVGRHEPGIQTYPILSTKDGTVVTDGPVMRATLPLAGGDAALRLALSGDIAKIEADSGAILDDEGPRNALRMNLADPRVHNLEQEWAVTYQGALPGFLGKAGDLHMAPDERTFTDASASFCGAGVQSQASARELWSAEGLTGSELDLAAARTADRLFISQSLADKDNTYWDTATCTWEACRATFGDVDVPTAARDLVVLEAYQDHLELGAPQGTTDEQLECCFPTLLGYELRAGDEWVVVGANTGFLHHVIADPASGQCRPSCDPLEASKVGRVRSHFFASDATTGVTPKDGEPDAFASMHFRFSVLVPTETDADPRAGLQRDMSFRFITQGNFIPLRGELTNSDRPTVAPQTIGYLPVIDELFVTDGGLEGLLIVASDLASDIRQYF